MKIKRVKPHWDIKTKLEHYRLITPDGHWLWQGFLNKNRYGIFGFEGKTWLVHRLAYFVYNSKNSDDTYICHIIDCKYRNCFNPEHVYSGDQYSNMMDRIISGNNPQLEKTHCPEGHEYTPENTYRNSKGARMCRICDKESTRRSRQRQKEKLEQHNQPLTQPTIIQEN